MLKARLATGSASNASGCSGFDELHQIPHCDILAARHAQPRLASATGTSRAASTSSSIRLRGRWRGPHGPDNVRAVAPNHGSFRFPPVPPPTGHGGPTWAAAPAYSRRPPERSSLGTLSRQRIRAAPRVRYRAIVRDCAVRHACFIPRPAEQFVDFRARDVQVRTLDRRIANHGLQDRHSLARPVQPQERAGHVVVDP
jgi:hypothetical protein